MKEAARAVGIFNKLRLPDVPGQPQMINAAGEWARDIVRAIFGSLDPVTKGRHVAELLGLVPKKNAKTTNGAGIMITALLMNERPRAEFLLIGPTQEIADLAFQQAVGMIEADEYLRKRFKIKEHIKTILDLTNKASLKIKTFDMKVMTGAKPAGVLIDEVHILSAFSFAARVFGQIRGGLLPNPEAFLIMITTQSDEPPSGVFKSELQYARGVRDGRIQDGRLLPILYEFPEAMQTDPEKPWRNVDNWPMVLPNLNLSITLDRLEADYAAAKEKGEEEERRWASQHLNVEIGLALHSDRWRGADFWEQSADTSLSFDELLERCDVVTIGGDGGGLDDLMGLCATGRCKVTKDYLQAYKAWGQRDVLKLRKDIASKLEDFVQDGNLTLCDDPTQDIKEFAEICEKFFKAGLLPDKDAIGLDPQGVSALVDELATRGIAGEMVVGISQGFRLSSAVWGTERKLKDGTLWHDGSRMMAWCVGNAKAEQKGNAVLITKQAAGKAKIDPLIAGFNSISLMSRNPSAKASVYEERGMVFI